VIERTPEKGRGTTGQGRPTDPNRRNRRWQARFRVPPFSARRQNRFDETRRPDSGTLPFDTGRYGVCGLVCSGYAVWPDLRLSGLILRQVAQGCAGRRDPVEELLATDRLSLSLRRSIEFRRYQHTERRGIPVSEGRLVRPENTAFLARREVSRNDGGGVV